MDENILASLLSRTEPDAGFGQDELTRQLNTKIIGRRVLCFAVLDSTNRTAFGLAEKGAAEGTAVFCEQQKHGRGRLGRLPWREYPAHFHINLVAGARDTWWTTAELIERFQIALLRRGIRKFHIQMLSHRVNLRRKFEMLNFEVWSLSQVSFRPPFRGRPAYFATLVREFRGGGDAVSTRIYRKMRVRRS